MNEKILNQEMAAQRKSLVEADPELDRIVEEINELIAVMMGYHCDPREPAYRAALEKKNKLQEENAGALLPYLKPYIGLEWKSDTQASSTIEWSRYRVAHNWNWKNQE